VPTFNALADVAQTMLDERSADDTQHTILSVDELLSVELVEATK